MHIKKNSFIEAIENYRLHLEINNFSSFKIIDYKVKTSHDVHNNILVVAIMSGKDWWKAYEKPIESIKDITIAELNRVAATGNKLNSQQAKEMFPELDSEYYDF